MKREGSDRNFNAIHPKRNSHLPDQYAMPVDAKHRMPKTMKRTYLTGQPSRQSTFYILAFATVPYFIARLLVLLGLRANEWWLTAHLGVIVAFIRRAGPAEVISSIFYCYAIAAALLAIPCFKNIIKTKRELSPKIAIYITCSFIYGILVAYSLLDGPSEGSFEPPYIRSHLGIQAAATNTLTYAVLCAVLTMQVALPIMFPLAIIQSARYR